MTVVVEKFFALLRIALSSSSEGLSVFSVCSPDEWLKLQELATNQGLVGIAYAGICRLPAEKRPPMELLLQWAGEAELIRGQNRMLNQEAARLTDIFAARGERSAILKGPANARLYPDPYSRQGGDIDIWVSGGHEHVLHLLQALGMPCAEEPKSLESHHHVHLAPGISEADVEVHFLPSSGCWNPFMDARLKRFLGREIENTEKVPEGFFVPSNRFALVMQMAHIQRHFMRNGIGLRQLTDYFVLLQRLTPCERDEIAALMPKFGLSRTCRALMWVLAYVFGLERSHMLCEPDARRGKWMLKDVIAGGNFGFFSVRERSKNFRRFLLKRCRSIRLFAFDPVEALWNEFYFWVWFFRTVSLRIRTRRVFLKGIRG